MTIQSCVDDGEKNRISGDGDAAESAPGGAWETSVVISAPTLGFGLSLVATAGGIARGVVVAVEAAKPAV